VDNQTLKSSNSLRHKDFLPFAYDLHCELEHHPVIQLKTAYLDSVMLDIKKFSDYYQELSHYDNWSLIDDLEMNRYNLWEKIIDRLDDNLNLVITDDYCELSWIKLTLENAYYAIPSYSASQKLIDLPYDTSEKIHFSSKRNAHGHFWNAKQMDLFISRLINPDVRALCETAGILYDVTALEKNQQQLDSALKTLHNLPLLNQLRETRYIICCGLSVYLSICQYPLKGYKETNFVNATELFEDRFLELKERKRMERSSIDLLPLSLFLSIAKNAVATFHKKMPDSGLYKSYQEDAPRLLKAYNAFRTDILWDQFEKEEHILYKELALLLDKITNYTQYFSCDNEELYQKFINSDSYDAAITLLYEYDDESTEQNGSDTKEHTASETYGISWEPGDSINYHAMIEILKHWGSAQNRIHLKLLKAEELFDNVVKYNDAVLQTASLIKCNNPDADLDILRQQRYYMNLFFDVISYHL